jgi:hypothetical protein
MILNFPAKILIFQDACPSSDNGVCNGGTCGASLCTCPDGDAGLDCTITGNGEVELFNGFAYAKTIKSVANSPFTGYLVLGNGIFVT